MKFYRIVTERKNVEDVRKLVDVAFDGYTLIEANGQWQGTAEPSLIIEIVASAHDARLVLATALAIKVLNGQQAVLVQTLDVESELI